jgi:hypothetical protein
LAGTTWTLGSWRRPLVGRLAAALLAIAAVSCGEDPPTAPSPPAVQPLTLTCPANVLGQSTTGAPVSLQV